LHVDIIKEEKIRILLLLRQGYKFKGDNIALRCSSSYLFLRVQEGIVVLAMHLRRANFKALFGIFLEV
jgi:hypothetical protein